MSDLINDLLTLSKASRQDLRVGPVDMQRLAETVLAEVLPAAERGRSDVTLHPLPAAVGDEGLVRQIFTNLLGNAVKFSAKKERRSIEVGARRIGDETAYFVRDDGVGFPAECSGRGSSRPSSAFTMPGTSRGRESGSPSFAASWSATEGASGPRARPAPAPRSGSSSASRERRRTWGWGRGAPGHDRAAIGAAPGEDLATSEQTWTDVVYEIHEVDRTSSCPSRSRIEERSHRVAPGVPASGPQTRAQGLTGGGSVTFVPKDAPEGLDGDRLVKEDGQVGRDSDGPAVGMVGLARDFTDERAVAPSALQAETFLEVFLEQSPIYVFFKDENIRAVRLSRNYEKLLGRPLSELLGKNMDELFPSDLAKAMVADDQRVLREGRPIEVQEDFGGRHYQTFKFPVVSAGAPAYLAGYTIDVTDRVRAEAQVRALNEGLESRVRERTADLEEANRELEAFAYSVSHDLRAPVRHLDGFLALLEEDLGSRLDGPAAHDIARARAAARRMGRLIDALLEFSRTRRTNLAKGTVQVGEIVAEVVDELRASDAARNVEWKVSELAAVEADRTLLRVVLFNLVSNAVKFTGKTDRPVVEIGPVSEPVGQTGFFVRDNGAGFDPAYSGKLFGVFQRLHHESEFEGLGIGLATVHRIVVRHGGRIRAESSPGAGATFFVTFPSGT